MGIQPSITVSLEVLGGEASHLEEDLRRRLTRHLLRLTTVKSVRSAVLDLRYHFATPSLMVISVDLNHKHRSTYMYMFFL